MAVGIVRDDLDAGGLRAAAAASRDGAAARRMLALALVVEGVDRTTAARTCGMDRQRCATGCIATTRLGCLGCRTGMAAGLRSC